MKKLGIILTVMIFAAVSSVYAATQNKDSKKIEKPVAAKSIDVKKYPLKGKHLENELQCTDCHAEGTDYKARVKQETCFNCHENYEAISKLTEKLGYDDNIHASPHYPKMDCDLCHKVHKPKSINYCAMCHSQETMQKLLVP